MNIEHPVQTMLRSIKNKDNIILGKDGGLPLQITSTLPKPNRIFEVNIEFLIH